MAALSDYLKAELMDHVLNGASYTSPTSVYVALFTDSQDSADAGTEVSGNAYARVTVTGGFTITGNLADNTAAVVFPQASGGNWGTIVSFGIYDAATVGNLLLFGDLTTQKLIEDLDTFAFESGDLDTTWD